MKLFLMPLLAGKSASFSYMFQGLTPPGEKAGYLGTFKTLLGNPAFALHALLTETRLVYLLLIFTPLLFLPLRRPLGWLFLLPGALFTLLSTSYRPLTMISFQYASNWTTYLFPATVLALAGIARARCPEDAGGPRRLHAALVGLVVVSLACSYQFGAVLQQHTARSGYRSFVFGTRPGDVQRRADLAALIAQVPPRAKIVSSETVVPHVSSRPDTYTLRRGLYDAEYMLLDLGQLLREEVTALREKLPASGFGLLAERPPFVLLRRGADPAGVPGLLQRLTASWGSSAKAAASPTRAAAAPTPAALPKTTVLVPAPASAPAPAGIAPDPSSVVP